MHEKCNCEHFNAKLLIFRSQIDPCSCLPGVIYQVGTVKWYGLRQTHHRGPSLTISHIKCNNIVQPGRGKRH